MTYFTNTLHAFKTVRTIGNAKRVASQAKKRPAGLDTPADAALIEEARRMVTEAKKPAKEA